jgi:predicted nucleic acid-binding Zn ribbon protein
LEKTCPECGGKILGRADKKFCSDGCRNAHNNNLNKDKTNLLRNVNNRLRKNYRLLQKLNAKDKTKVKKETLLKHGFNFNFFTGQYVTKTGSVYFYVYDQGYLALENDWYLLVKVDITL